VRVVFLQREQHAVKAEHHASFQAQLPRRLQTQVRAMTLLAADTIGVELRPVAVGPLPAFTAGSHIELHLANGLSRSYSLVNGQDETDRYELAVKREVAGKGGSAYIHERLRLGDVVEISSPRNNFMLEEAAPHSILFAGGIGITPIMSMADRLTKLGRPFELYYGVRSRDYAVFADRLKVFAEVPGTSVHFQFDDEMGGQRIDIRGIVDAAPDRTHFYCCGPSPMIAAFEAALSHIPDARVHREHFSGTAALGRQGGFDVVLTRSGRTIRIPDGQTILETLLGEGIDVEFSCMEGFCGSCKVNVVEGVPDHKDTVLSATERASNKVMLLCCSTAVGEKLVLDL
jgi:ferredoxin-NADP reductase